MGALARVTNGTSPRGTDRGKIAADIVTEARPFPLLSGAGGPVVKDAIMKGGARVTMADSAKAYLRMRAAAPSGLGRREAA